MDYKLWLIPSITPLSNTSFNHKSISLGQSWTVKRLSVASKGENDCVWSSRKCRVCYHCTEIGKHTTKIHKYKTTIFDHLGSAGACHHCTQLQSLVLERAKKNCHSWCCTVVHFKTHIPVIAYCLGKYWERGKEYCIHSALENILSFQKLSLVPCRENVPYDLDFVIKSMSNTLHREYA